MSTPAKDGHSLARLIETRLERNRGRCYLAPSQLREYGLKPDDIGEWAREAGFEVQLPLFPGGMYELRRAE